MRPNACDSEQLAQSPPSGKIASGAMPHVECHSEGVPETICDPLPISVKKQPKTIPTRAPQPTSDSHFAITPKLPPAGGSGAPPGWRSNYAASQQTPDGYVLRGTSGKLYKHDDKRADANNNGLAQRMREDDSNSRERERESNGQLRRASGGRVWFYKVPPRSRLHGTESHTRAVSPVDSFDPLIPKRPITIAPKLSLGVAHDVRLLSVKMSSNGKARITFREQSAHESLRKITEELDEWAETEPNWATPKGWGNLVGMVPIDVGIAVGAKMHGDGSEWQRAVLRADGLEYGSGTDVYIAKHKFQVHCLDTCEVFDWAGEPFKTLTESMCALPATANSMEVTSLCKRNEAGFKEDAREIHAELQHVVRIGARVRARLSVELTRHGCGIHYRGGVGIF